MESPDLSTRPIATHSARLPAMIIAYTAAEARADDPFEQALYQDMLSRLRGCGPVA